MKQNRNQRIAIAQETVAIVSAGSYVAPSGTKVDISPSQTLARQKTVIHDLDTLPELPTVANKLSTRIEVTPETTFEALDRLFREGANALGCLNFASAKNPGGGFLTGAQAQEEALARSSGLYECLLTQPGYYERNRANRSCLYLDVAIVSPGVPFLRDDQGQLLERPLLATVITSPAPNAGAVEANEPAAVPRILPVLEKRAEMVLRMAVLHEVANLVLGAWGCGVFRNEPTAVAETFKRLLGPGGTYHGRFQRVVFAVYDPSEARPNFSAFLRVFSN